MTQQIIGAICTKRYRYWLVIGLLVLIFVSLLASSAQAQILSDKDLFERGRQAYERQAWLQAALYLNAYAQRNPDQMRRNANHRQQVMDALDYAIDQINETFADLDSVSAELAQCKPQASNGLAAHVGGLTMSPPQLETITELQPKSYPLVCRGGGSLYFDYNPSSTLSNKPQVWITFVKAAQGVGLQHEHVGLLQPGQCSWLDRPIAGAEPSQIVILNPLLGEHDFGISWREGQVAGISSVLSYVNALQSENKLQIFDVYNDNQGNFIVTKIDPNVYVFPAQPTIAVATRIFDDDPRHNRRDNEPYFCSGFASECDFGGCALNQRLVWGPFCREGDYPYIQPGQYRVQVYGEGNVRLGATDYGSSKQMFSFGEYDTTLPTDFSFCWPGREANGYGFETIILAQEQNAYVERITIEYLGSACVE